jgi:hypothetical protein
MSGQGGQSSARRDCQPARPGLPRRRARSDAPYLSHRCQELPKGVCASAAGHRAALTSPAFIERLERCRKESPSRAGFLKVGIAALRRPRRRAQRQAPENASQGECFIPVRSALSGGGIAARCPLPAWMVESHFETRFRIKLFYRTEPHRTSTVLAVPTPRQGYRAAASTGRAQRPATESDGQGGCLMPIRFASRAVSAQRADSPTRARTPFRSSK